MHCSIIVDCFPFNFHEIPTFFFKTYETIQRLQDFELGFQAGGWIFEQAGGRISGRARVFKAGGQAGISGRRTFQVGGRFFGAGGLNATYATARAGPRSIKQLPSMTDLGLTALS